MGFTHYVPSMDVWGHHQKGTQNAKVSSVMSQQEAINFERAHMRNAPLNLYNTLYHKMPYNYDWPRQPYSYTPNIKFSNNTLNAPFPAVSCHHTPFYPAYANYHLRYPLVSPPYRPDQRKQINSYTKRRIYNNSWNHPSKTDKQIHITSEQAPQDYTNHRCNGNSSGVKSDQINIFHRNNTENSEGEWIEQEPFQQYQNEYSNQHINNGTMFIDENAGYNHVMPLQNQQVFPPYQIINDSQYRIPPGQISPHPGAMMPNVNMLEGHGCNYNATEQNGFHYKLPYGSSQTMVTSQLNYSQEESVYMAEQESCETMIQKISAPASSNHLNYHSYFHQSPHLNFEEDNKLRESILQDSQSFVKNFCPLLGQKLYCFPPIKRHIHQDKQLVQGIESEKRVLGSFQRYFAQNECPVFMLCHYPLTGFMKVFLKKSDNMLDCDLSFLKNGKNVKGTITLLLFSNLFAVTIVTVSTLSSNCDIAFIKRGVKKTFEFNKQCSAALSNWLEFLRIRPEVRQVIAFPNLKRSILHRIRKEKAFNQDYSSVFTLHADDLPPPFEEEWSTDEHKELFTNWVQKSVMIHPPTLTIQELHLLVGALLSPKFSKVDFVHDEKEISTVDASPQPLVSPEPVVEDVGKLQLTVGGITKRFDEYMEAYVTSFYPDLEKRTYRVPPIHFNIQQMQSASEYLAKKNPDHSVNDTNDEKKVFMPNYPAFVMTDKGSYFINKNGIMNNSQIYEAKSRRNLPSPPVGAACLESLKDVDVLMEVMTKDIRADEGENRVISFFEMIGRLVDPMFIICGYQYNNYLNKLREEMFSKEDTTRPVRAFGQTMRAEHDCLIFHQKYGAIIVCIKSVGDNFAEWSTSEDEQIICTKKILEKAVKQLDREESMIRHVTSDLKANLTIHKLIALPNMTRETVETVLSSDLVLKIKIEKSLTHNGSEISRSFICSDELPPRKRAEWDYYEKPNMQKILKKQWNKMKLLFNNENEEIPFQEYKQLIGRYCGLFSTVEVWSPNSTRVEVRNSSQAVSECADRYRRMILLPSQTNALCSNNSLFYLYGPPGSGKTLILTLKAKEWLLTGENVIIMNARGGTQYGFPYAYGMRDKLHHMMKDLKIDPEKLKLINIDFFNWDASQLSEIMPTSCIIMDEVTPASHEIIEHLSSLQVKNIWCAGLCEEHKPVTARSFTTCEMDIILRCPPIVQSLLKEAEEFVWHNSRYKNIYQCSVVEKNDEFIQKSEENVTSKISDSKTAKKHQNTDKFIKNNSTKNSSEFINGTKDVVLKSETHNNSQNKANLINDRLEKFKKVKSAAINLEENKPGVNLITSLNNTKNKMSFLNNVSFNKKSDQMENCNQEYDCNLESLCRRLNNKYGLKFQKIEKPKDLTSTENNITPGELLRIKLADKYNSNSVLNKIERKYNLITINELSCNESTEVNSLSENEHNKMNLAKEVNLIKDASEGSTESVKLDSRSLNKRLQKKYSKVNVIHKDNPLFHRYILPTDGPRPYFIKHYDHSMSGNPTDCSICGSSIAELLVDMVKPVNTPAVTTKKTVRSHRRGSISTLPGNDHINGDILFSNTLPIYSKLPTSFGPKFGSSFEKRNLKWSDVLIVAAKMPKNCSFIMELKKKDIPVKILMNGKTFEIESANENKLFITSFKEVTGLERSLMIFVPSEPSENPNFQTDDYSASDFSNLSYFSVNDKMFLYHVASRSLASLVIIVP